MKKFLVAAAAASFLLAACSDDENEVLQDGTQVEVDEAAPLAQNIEEALLQAQTDITPQLTNLLGVAEEDVNVSFTANTEQEPPAAIATVILLTNPEIAEEKIDEAVTLIQEKLEAIEGVSVHVNNIMITNIEGDVLH